MISKFRAVKRKKYEGQEIGRICEVKEEKIYKKQPVKKKKS
jgi:hypothetical protein